MIENLIFRVIELRNVGSYIQRSKIEIKNVRVTLLYSQYLLRNIGLGETYVLKYDSAASRSILFFLIRNKKKILGYLTIEISRNDILLRDRKCQLWYPLQKVGHRFFSTGNLVPEVSGQVKVFFSLQCPLDETYAIPLKFFSWFPNVKIDEHIYGVHTCFLHVANPHMLTFRIINIFITSNNICFQKEVSRHGFRFGFGGYGKKHWYLHGSDNVSENRNLVIPFTSIISLKGKVNYLAYRISIKTENGQTITLGGFGRRKYQKIIDSLSKLWKYSKKNVDLPTAVDLSITSPLPVIRRKNDHNVVSRESNEKEENQKNENENQKNDNDNEKEKEKELSPCYNFFHEVDDYSKGDTGLICGLSLKVKIDQYKIFKIPHIRLIEFEKSCNVEEAIWKIVKDLSIHVERDIFNKFDIYLLKRRFFSRRKKEYLKKEYILENFISSHMKCIHFSLHQQKPQIESESSPDFLSLTLRVLFETYKTSDAYAKVIIVNPNVSVESTLLSLLGTRNPVNEWSEFENRYLQPDDYVLFKPNSTGVTKNQGIFLDNEHYLKDYLLHDGDLIILKRTLPYTFTEKYGLEGNINFKSCNVLSFYLIAHCIIEPMTYQENVEVKEKIELLKIFQKKFQITAEQSTLCIKKAKYHSFFGLESILCEIGYQNQNLDLIYSKDTFKTQDSFVRRKENRWSEIYETLRTLVVDNSNFYGLLRITVDHAKNVKLKASKYSNSTKNSFFVVLTYGNIQRRTFTCENTVDPVWHETFSIPITNLNSNKLQIQLLTWDTTLDEAECAKVFLNDQRYNILDGEIHNYVIPIAGGHLSISLNLQYRGSKIMNEIMHHQEIELDEHEPAKQKKIEDVGLTITLLNEIYEELSNVIDENANIQHQKIILDEFRIRYGISKVYADLLEFKKKLDATEDFTKNAVENICNQYTNIVVDEVPSSYLTSDEELVFDKITNRVVKKAKKSIYKLILDYYHSCQKQPDEKQTQIITSTIANCLELILICLGNENTKHQVKICLIEIICKEYDQICSNISYPPSPVLSLTPSVSQHQLLIEKQEIEVVKKKNLLHIGISENLQKLLNKMITFEPTFGNYEISLIKTYSKTLDSLLSNDIEMLLETRKHEHWPTFHHLLISLKKLSSIMQQYPEENPNSDPKLPRFYNMFLDYFERNQISRFSTTRDLLYNSAADTGLHDRPNMNINMKLPSEDHNECHQFDTRHSQLCNELGEKMDTELRSLVKYSSGENVIPYIAATEILCTTFYQYLKTMHMILKQKKKTIQEDSEEWISRLCISSSNLEYLGCLCKKLKKDLRTGIKKGQFISLDAKETALYQIKETYISMKNDINPIRDYILKKIAKNLVKMLSKNNLLEVETPKNVLIIVEKKLEQIATIMYRKCYKRVQILLLRYLSLVLEEKLCSSTDIEKYNKYRLEFDLLSNFFSPEIEVGTLEEAENFQKAMKLWHICSKDLTIQLHKSNAKREREQILTILRGRKKDKNALAYIAEWENAYLHARNMDLRKQFLLQYSEIILEVGNCCCSSSGKYGDFVLTYQYFLWDSRAESEKENSLDHQIVIPLKNITLCTKKRFNLVWNAMVIQTNTSKTFYFYRFSTTIEEVMKAIIDQKEKSQSE